MRADSGERRENKIKRLPMDTEPPKLYWYSWNLEENLLYCPLSDDQSGIDYTQIYKEDKNEKCQSPIEDNPDAGEERFQLSDDEFYIYLYDNSNNFAKYRIEKYKVEEP